jgi:hypothetical protein
MTPPRRLGGSAVAVSQLGLGTALVDEGRVVDDLMTWQRLVRRRTEHPTWVSRARELLEARRPPRTGG